MSRKQSLGYLLTLVSFLLNLSLAWSVDIADLRLRLEALTSIANADGSIPIQIVVENHGPSDATNISLTCRLPADCKAVVASEEDRTTQQSNYTLTAFYPAITASSASTPMLLVVKSAARGPLNLCAWVKSDTLDLLYGSDVTALSVNVNNPNQSVDLGVSQLGQCRPCPA